MKKSLLFTGLILLLRTTLFSQSLLDEARILSEASSFSYKAELEAELKKDPNLKDHVEALSIFLNEPYTVIKVPQLGKGYKKVLNRENIARIYELMDSIRTAHETKSGDVIQRFNDLKLKVSTSTSLDSVTRNDLLKTLNEALNPLLATTDANSKQKAEAIMNSTDKLLQNSYTTNYTYNSITQQQIDSKGSSFRMPSEAEMIDALAIFIANRFKEEVALTFVDKLKKRLCNDSLLTQLFPKTTELLVKTDIYEMPSFGNNWQYAFANDISDLPKNIGKADIPWLNKQFRDFLVQIIKLYEIIRNGGDYVEMADFFADYFHFHQNEKLCNVFSVIKMVAESFVYYNDHTRFISFGQYKSMGEKEKKFFHALFFIRNQDILEIIRITEADIAKTGDLIIFVNETSTKIAKMQNIIADASKIKGGGKDQAQLFYSFIQLNQELITNTLDFVQLRTGNMDKKLDDFKYIIDHTYEFYMAMYEKKYGAMLGIGFDLLEHFMDGSINNDFVQGTLYYSKKLLDNKKIKAAITEKNPLLLDLLEHENLTNILMEHAPDSTDLEAGLQVVRQNALDIQKKILGYEAEIKKIRESIDKADPKNEIAAIKEAINKADPKAEIDQYKKAIAALEARIQEAKNSFILNKYDDYKTILAELQTIVKEVEGKSNRKLLDPLIALDKEIGFSSSIYSKYSSVQQRKYYSGLLKATSFFADVLKAENSNDLSKVINAYASPVSSYKIKRHSRFSVDLNAYVGVSFIQERKISLVDTVAHTRKLTNMSYGFAFSTPVGITLSWGGKIFPMKKSKYKTSDELYLSPRNKLKKLRGNSISLALTFIDLGAITAFRLTTGNEAALPEDIDIRQFISPAAHLVWGIKGTPLCFMAGAQVTPRLRSFEQNESPAPTFRANLGLAFDIPIFHLGHSAYGRKKFTKTK